MRVVQVPKPHARHELVDRPMPEPGPREVRIKVEACIVTAISDITPLSENRYLITSVFQRATAYRNAQRPHRYLPRNASTIAAEKAAEWRGCGEVTRLRSTTTGASCTQVAPAASASGCTTSSG